MGILTNIIYDVLKSREWLDLNALDGLDDVGSEADPANPRGQGRRRSRDMTVRDVDALLIAT